MNFIIICSQCISYPQCLQAYTGFRCDITDGLERQGCPASSQVKTESKRVNIQVYNCLYDIM